MGRPRELTFPSSTPLPARPAGSACGGARRTPFTLPTVTGVQGKPGGGRPVPPRPSGCKTSGEENNRGGGGRCVARWLYEQVNLSKKTSGDGGEGLRRRERASRLPPWTRESHPQRRSYKKEKKARHTGQCSHGAAAAQDHGRPQREVVSTGCGGRVGGRAGGRGGAGRGAPPPLPHTPVRLLSGCGPPGCPRAQRRGRGTRPAPPPLPTPPRTASRRRRPGRPT